MASQDPEEVLRTLEEQERRLVLPSLGHDDAWRLGMLLVELARKRNAPVAIDIHCGVQQLFHSALPGSSADNDAWIDRKRRVVERYAESSAWWASASGSGARRSRSPRGSTPTATRRTEGRFRCA